MCERVHAYHANEAVPFLCNQESAIYAYRLNVNTLCKKYRTLHRVRRSYTIHRTYPV